MGITFEQNINKQYKITKKKMKLFSSLALLAVSVSALKTMSQEQTDKLKELSKCHNDENCTLTVAENDLFEELRELMYLQNSCILSEDNMVGVTVTPNAVDEPGLSDAQMDALIARIKDKNLEAYKELNEPQILNWEAIAKRFGTENKEGMFSRFEKLKDILSNRNQIVVI